MQFTTPVALPGNGPDISHTSRIMLVGSCFADNIGKRLQERKFNICTNPFGVQYNPLSIATVLKRVLSGEKFTENSCEIFEHGGMWHSILHHSAFSRASREELLSVINQELIKAHNMAQGCDTVVLTFGTAYTYRRKSDGIVAGNCHKLPGNLFDRRMLEIDEIVAHTTEAIELFRKENPHIKFLFTVSPIRHLSDGAHNNQVSKATLLLAIERLRTQFPDNTFYFPAYEIVLDELRDYRFFAEDMAHPSAVAVEYIWERFSDCFFSKETKGLNREIESILRGLSHRPFTPGSIKYKEFIKTTIDNITLLKERHTSLDFENEIRQCNILLNR